MYIAEFETYVFLNFIASKAVILNQEVIFHETLNKQGLVFENARRATNFPPGIAQMC